MLCVVDARRRFAVIQVVASAIVDKYIGESARVVREMFGYAKVRSGRAKGGGRFFSLPRQTLRCFFAFFIGFFSVKPDVRKSGSLIASGEAEGGNEDQALAQQ